MKEIDARGLACPAPVLQTKAVLQEDNPGQVRVTVDNAASQQNVQRFLESRGYEIDIEQRRTDFIISGTRGPRVGQDPLPIKTGPESNGKIMFVCATDRMGFGDDDLGRQLMINFLSTLKEMGSDLWHLVFVNNGVKLTIDDSEVLPDLQALEKNGVKIRVCGTCLNHFKLLERKRFGETTNMLDIVTAMQLAGKVVNL